MKSYAALFPLCISRIDDVRMMWKGDRIISALGYVQGGYEQGAATIFPELDIYVPLIKSNLLIWENLDLITLKPLKKSSHASCPLIYGPKIVLNKWLRAFL